MYTEFYNLNENPFDLTPSPHYLYLSETHREALALLKYGVMERKGFVLLMGYSSEKTRISPAMVKASFKDTRIRKVRKSSLWKYTAAFAALLLLAGAFGITETGQNLLTLLF